MKALGTTCGTCMGLGMMDHAHSPPAPVARASGSFSVLPCLPCAGAGVILTDEERQIALSLLKAMKAVQGASWAK